MEAGFSHFAAILGFYFNTLEKEQKSAALTSLQSYKYNKNQTADVKGNISKMLQISWIQGFIFFFTDPAVLNRFVNLQHIRKKWLILLIFCLSPTKQF